MQESTRTDFSWFRAFLIVIVMAVAKLGQGSRR